MIRRLAYALADWLNENRRLRARVTELLTASNYEVDKRRSLEMFRDSLSASRDLWMQASLRDRGTVEQLEKQLRSQELVHSVVVAEREGWEYLACLLGELLLKVRAGDPVVSKSGRKNIGQ